MCVINYTWLPRSLTMDWIKIVVDAKMLFVLNSVVWAQALEKLFHLWIL